MAIAPENDPRPRRASHVAWGLALALVSLVAASSGLLGGWIHDDIQMQDNPQYSGLDDVLATFTRHSGDYARTPDAERSGAMSRTYRPLPMLTLVATQAVAPTPWSHHLLGWLLHLATAAVLFCALRRSDPRATSQRAHRLLAALFLLHPVGVETYVWINGRSDLLAGLCLAALLFVLSSDAVRSAKTLCGVFVLVFLGSASKETFAPAALLASVALAFPRGGASGSIAPALRGGASGSIAPALRGGASGSIAPALRGGASGSIAPALRGGASVRAVFAAVLGVGGYVLARACVVPNTSASLGQSGNPFASASGWLLIPKLVAVASYPLLSMRAAAMQSLGWNLFRDLSAGEWFSGLIALVAFVTLLWRRDFRGVTLMAAAGACTVPAVLVVYVLWLGLDRYLYMPLLLLLFAASPYLVDASEFIGRRMPRLWSLAVGGVLVVAAANTFVASRAYHNQALWLATLADERPDDPVTMIFLAKELGQPAATALLQHFPPPPWPLATIVPLIAFSLSSGQTSLARQAAEYGMAHYSDNHLIVAHAFRLRYLGGKKTQALAMLPVLSSDPTLCPDVRSQLQIWAKSSAGVDRDQLDAAIVGMHCQALQ